ncbi:MAG: hypothetical protein AABY22_27055, partial [Nanoarchaeota archaeon]
MDVVKKYPKLFKKFTNVTFSALSQKDSFYQEKYFNILHKILSKYELPSYISKEDISQQLALMWHQFFLTYKEKRPDIRLRQYLIRRSIWGLRDWLLTECKNKTHILEDIYYTDEPVLYDFEISFKFLIKGSDHLFLNDLTAYERYILFLKFKEDKTIKEIS